MNEKLVQTFLQINTIIKNNISNFKFIQNIQLIKKSKLSYNIFAKMKKRVNFFKYLHLH